MDVLKPDVTRYMQIKEQIKTLSTDKKNLEKHITETMSKNNINSIELPDGKILNYELKETLVVKK